MLRLSALDQSPVRSGGSPAEAIRETLDLARATDRLGYHRYWLAEHHSTPALAGPSPEVLIPEVAAVTSGIRVGSGGVMLQHYSALKVAEQFRVLETLHPGRIDLGIGRAPGSDQLTARALAGPAGVGVDDFVGKVADVLGFLNGDLPPEHPFGSVLAMPTGPTTPEVWLLGSSDQSAMLAAHFGVGFSFAHFINADGGAEVTRAYTRAFKPSPAMAEPRASIAVFVVCAPTEEEAVRLAQSRDLFIVRLYTGRMAPYPSVDEAAIRPWPRRRRTRTTPASG
jgi:luciferase family oxidoreductase group 1